MGIAEVPRQIPYYIIIAPLEAMEDRDFIKKYD